MEPAGMKCVSTRLSAVSALVLAGAVPTAGLIAVAAFATPAMAQKALITPVNIKGGVALKGYDPVAYFSDGKPVKGEPSYLSRYKGATYQFASAAHRDTFAADPAKYAPQYGGYCAQAISTNKIADISPNAWKVVDQKLYLNNNIIAQKLWEHDNAEHIVKGDRNWPAYPKAATVAAGVAPFR